MVTGVTAAPILEMRKPRHRVESMSWDYATTKLRLQIRSPSLPVESQMCLSSQLAQKPMPQGQGRPGEASAVQPVGLCPFSRSLLPTPIPLPTCLSWHFAFPKEEKHHPPYHSPLTLTLTSTKGQFRLVLRTHNYRQTHSLNNLPDQILGMERVNPGPLVSHSIEGGERCYGKPTPKHPI